MATRLYPSASPFDPVVEIQEGRTDAGNTCANISYVALCQDAYRKRDASPGAPRDRVLIATVTADLLRTYPIHIRRESDDYLQPKYGKVKTLSFPVGEFGWRLPEEQLDFVGLLDTLPAGFSKQFQYGLGLKWEYRYFVHAIEGFDEVTEIAFTPGDEARIEGPIFYLGLKYYDQLRRGVNSITRRNQQEAADDKRLLAYTNLQRRVAPERFAVRTKKLRPNAIYELVKLGVERSSFTPHDRRAAMDLVRAEKVALSKTEPADLLSLKREIEEVTLTTLIEKFETMLVQELPESRWQAFFKANPFIVSLAFAYPIFVIQDQAHIGGATLQGMGEKIADFLSAQHYTGNLGLIEIKRPGTSLLSKIAYRTDLLGPSKEITGAMSQVLDQRFKLHTNFTQKAYASNLRDVHPYAIECVLIAGSSPTDQTERKSLELFRHATKDIVLITFDELLQKLKEIQRVFALGEALGKPSAFDSASRTHEEPANAPPKPHK